MNKDKMEAALNICNTLPGHVFDDTIKMLSRIDQSITNNILINKEGSIKIKYDKEENKYYLGNMFNKEKDSYRSPYTNIYFPEHYINSYVPPEHLRTLEILYNNIFDRYRKAYYMNGLSSVYLWPNPIEDGFVACFLIKKEEIFDKETNIEWEATHLIQVNIRNLNVYYQISCTINFEIKKYNDNLLLSGNINKALENSKKVTDLYLIKDQYFHMENMGYLIECMENSLRKSIEYIYILKIQDMLNSIKHYNFTNHLTYNNSNKNISNISNSLIFSREYIQKELQTKIKQVRKKKKEKKSIF
ncbi:f-actin capping protein beta subunit, putative [Plasmodium reichenowi]|uniref:F-actin-capping protein subunit beta n=1 Tax=Plasmodium reichenowi TaxID=5854 RepID=A0A060RPG0_PLARE|nr:f-actin capping protein beta subunit, putative [Plasmodium reichenowi]